MSKVDERLVTTEKLKRAPDGAVLLCTYCGSEFSANYGDYSFWRDDDEPFTCNHGESDNTNSTYMVLAIHHNTIEVIDV